MNSYIILGLASLLPFLIAKPLMAAEINEANLQTLFNSADLCIANAATIQSDINRYTCCNIMEQTWQFVNTLDLTPFSPQLQQHAANLYNAILPLTGGPLGVGTLGPIIDGVAQGCLPPCDPLTNPSCRVPGSPLP